MAIGDITKSAINTLVLDTAGLSSVPLHVSGNIYAVAIVGPSGDGWIHTFSCNSAGEQTAIDDFEFEADVVYQYHLDFKRISESDGTFAVVYRGPDLDGWLKTIGIQANGTINGIDASWEFSTEGGWPKLLQRSGTVWIIAFDNFGSIRVGTTTINNDGTIGSAWIDYTDVLAKGAYIQIAYVSGDFHALVYYDGIGRGKVASIEIDSSGNVAAALQHSAQFDTGMEAIGNVIKMADNNFVFGYDSDSTFICTFTISDAGACAITATQAVGSDCDMVNMLRIPETDYYAIVQTETAPNILQTWDVSEAGVISGSAQDSWTFVNPGDDPNIIRASGSIYIVTYVGTGGDFRSMTVTIDTPGILSPDDAMIRVTNLIHRYSRKDGVWELEMALGEVTSDFGMPQWLTQAMSAAPSPTPTIPYIAPLNIPQAPVGPGPIVAPSQTFAKIPFDPFYGDVPMTSAKMTSTTPLVGTDPFNRSGLEMGPDGLLHKKVEKNWWEFWK